MQHQKWKKTKNESLLLLKLDTIFDVVASIFGIWLADWLAGQMVGHNSQHEQKEMLHLIHNFFFLSFLVNWRKSSFTFSCDASKNTANENSSRNNDVCLVRVDVDERLMVHSCSVWWEEGVDKLVWRRYYSPSITSTNVIHDCRLTLVVHWQWRFYVTTNCYKQRRHNRRRQLLLCRDVWSELRHSFNYSISTRINFEFDFLKLQILWEERYEARTIGETWKWLKRTKSLTKGTYVVVVLRMGSGKFSKFNFILISFPAEYAILFRHLGQLHRDSGRVKFTAIHNYS